MAFSLIICAYVCMCICVCMCGCASVFIVGISFLGMLIGDRKSNTCIVIDLAYNPTTTIGVYVYDALATTISY